MRGGEVAFGEKASEVAPSKVPLKGFGDGMPIVLEGDQPFGKGSEVGKLIGSEHFSLDDGKVDLDLVEPTGMNRQVKQDESGELLLEPMCRSQAAMGGAVINDPENTAGVVIRRARHHLFDETLKGSHSISGLATAKNFGAVNV